MKRWLNYLDEKIIDFLARQFIATIRPCKSSKDHSKPRNEVDTSLKSPV